MDGMTDVIFRNPKTDPVVSARVTSVSFSVIDALPSATIQLQLYRQSGAGADSRTITVRDGDDPSERWLTGTGQGAQPVGLLRGILETPDGERGSVQARFIRRILTWVKANKADLDDMDVA